MQAAVTENDRRKAEWAAQGYKIWWQVGPEWYDAGASSSQVWWLARNLLDYPGVDCDLVKYFQAAVANASWQYMGSYGKGIRTFFCIGLGDPPPLPPDPEDPPPDPGPTDCGVWYVNWGKSDGIKLGVPIWIPFEIVGSFPPEVTLPPTFRFLFDALEGAVLPDTVSGILQTDPVGRRVEVVLLDTTTHRLDVEVRQEGCSAPVKQATVYIFATEEIPAIYRCVEKLSSPAIQVCIGGNYHVVLTVCGQDFASPPLTVVPPPVAISGPIIIKHPQSVSEFPGDSLHLEVTAKYATTYQWQRKIGGVWVDVVGQTTPFYNVDNVTPESAGDYRVVVANPAGSVISNTATVTVDCQGWQPSIDQTAGETYTIDGRVVLQDGSELTAAAGIDTGTETLSWVVDGNIIPPGPGTAPGITFSLAGDVLTVTITDSNWHTVAFLVDSQACEQNKQIERLYYGPRPSDFGFTPNPSQTLITKEVADYSDPSVFVQVVNRSTYTGSLVEFQGAFAAVVSTGMIASITPQFTKLGPGEAGTIKVILSSAGIAALKAGNVMPSEQWRAPWLDNPAIAAFDPAALGNFDLFVTFSTTATTTIRWGHSKALILTEAEIEALDFVKVQTSINADLGFATQGDSGNYVYIALPAGGQVPRPGNGIALLDQEQPFVEAGPSDGFTDRTGADGWSCKFVGAWMLFRSAYDLNNPGTLRITSA